MGINLNSKNQVEDIFENMKILATTVEALNRHIEGGTSSNTNTISAVNPATEQKLDALMKNMAILNNNVSNSLYQQYNKLNQQNTKLYQQNILLDKKFSGFLEQYTAEKKKMEVFVEKNAAVLDLLKATVVLLEEMLELFKEREKKAIETLETSRMENNKISKKI